MTIRRSESSLQSTNGFNKRLSNSVPARRLCGAPGLEWAFSRLMLTSGPPNAICLTASACCVTRSPLFIEIYAQTSAPLPITDEIQQIKARLRELQNQQLEELRARRRELAEELAYVERQIADITGAPVQPAAPLDGEAPRKRAAEASETGEGLRGVQGNRPERADHPGQGADGPQWQADRGCARLPADERAEPHQGIAERSPPFPENRAGRFHEVLFALRIERRGGLFS